MNKFKFEEHINSNDIVLDFGCGGGYLLNNFENIIRKGFENIIRKGFEINEYAWGECKKNGVQILKKIIINPVFIKDIENMKKKIIIYKLN